MDMNKLTIKAQEALGASQNLALTRGHQEVDAEHLALALLRQQDGLVPGIVKRMGFRLDTLDRELAGMQDVLDKLQAREDALREERDRDPGYGDQISDLEAQIEKIDKKLGVKK